MVLLSLREHVWPLLRSTLWSRDPRRARQDNHAIFTLAYMGRRGPANGGTTVLTLTTRVTGTHTCAPTPTQSRVPRLLRSREGAALTNALDVRPLGRAPSTGQGRRAKALRQTVLPLGAAERLSALLLVRQEQDRPVMVATTCRRLPRPDVDSTSSTF